MLPPGAFLIFCSLVNAVTKPTSVEPNRCPSPGESVAKTQKMLETVDRPCILYTKGCRHGLMPFEWLEWLESDLPTLRQTIADWSPEASNPDECNCEQGVELCTRLCYYALFEIQMMHLAIVSERNCDSNGPAPVNWRDRTRRNINNGAQFSS